MKDVKITFVGHSCFFVETKTAMFLFDYYEGEIPKIAEDKELYVFVSHQHYDHFNRKVLEIGRMCKRKFFVFSSDLMKSQVEGDSIIYVEPNQKLKVGNCVVKTLRSTDLGVAFYVKEAECCIYHAGDLNWWHWDDESDEYNQKMEIDYKEEIVKLRDKKIDFAFLPLDGRLGANSGLGIAYFSKQIDVEYIFPMHFFGDQEKICNQFIEKSCEKLMVLKPGESWNSRRIYES